LTTAQDGGKVVSLTHRPPLPQGRLLCRPQGHRAIGSIMSVTPSGIELATFRFVAQYLIKIDIASSNSQRDKQEQLQV
jgi:hypothetical protein